MPFLEKLADIAVSGRHVGNMSATFPAKCMIYITLIALAASIKMIILFQNCESVKQLAKTNKLN
jgi:hypothetical protein